MLRIHRTQLGTIGMAPVPLAPASPAPSAPAIGTIGSAQYAPFKAVALTRFENEMLRHIEEHFPVHWRVIGAESLRQLVRLGCERGKRYGLRTRRDAGLFVSMMLYLGSHFDSDMQLPWARMLLEETAAGGPATRVERALDATLMYLDKVWGPDNQLLVQAIGRFHRALSLLVPGARIGREDMRSLCLRAYPQRFSALGQASLDALIDHAARSSVQLGIGTPRGAAVLLALMAIAGHGIAEDPQHEWLRAALEQPAATSLDAKLDELHRSAVAHTRAWWSEH
ncbi:MAG: hypothetical protein IT531_07365 [Burkholderiales bacterium]|nr:hypothetical protein [Burkholderiales bacterium]